MTTTTLQYTVTKVRGRQGNRLLLHAFADHDEERPVAVEIVVHEYVLEASYDDRSMSLVMPHAHVVLIAADQEIFEQLGAAIRPSDVADIAEGAGLGILGR